MARRCWRSTGRGVPVGKYWLGCAVRGVPVGRQREAVTVWKGARRLRGAVRQLPVRDGVCIHGSVCNHARTCMCGRRGLCKSVGHIVLGCVGAGPWCGRPDCGRCLT